MDDPAPVVGARLDLLRALGYDALQHDSHVPFLSHLIGTRRVLAGWGSRPALCDAGLFHSVYGTEFFVPDRTPDRAEVVAVIGAEAERIAWLWCFGERATLAPATASIRIRTSGEIEPLTEQEVTDVATLWAADTVEQLHRMEPELRAFSTGVLDVVDEISETARAAVLALTF
jgi:xanthine dehydrogenase iron-sulfur cluster and FAD-binding subunit A